MIKKMLDKKHNDANMLSMKNKENLVRTTVYLTNEQHFQLKRIYADRGKRIAESIRDAVDEWLKKNMVC